MNFTFEIVEQGEPQRPPKILRLPNKRAIWGYVEALAIQMLGRNGAVIRVKNSHGETIVRAGIRTALTSIKSCPCSDCALKRELPHAATSPRQAVETRDFEFECPLSLE